MQLWCYDLLLEDLVTSAVTQPVDCVDIVAAVEQGREDLSGQLTSNHQESENENKDVHSAMRSSSSDSHVRTRSGDVLSFRPAG